jgi:peptide/nickel transport system substrate-binding protein
LEKAGKLLDEAGWIDTDGDGLRDKDGVPFKFKFMYSSESALYKRLVELLKDEAAKLGIEVIPDPYEWSVLVPRLSDRKFEATVRGWGGDVLEDFYQIFHSSQIGNRGASMSGSTINRQIYCLSR